MSGWEGDNHLPTRDFAYNFVKEMASQSAEVPCSCLKERSVLTVKDLEIWQKYTEDGLVFNPKFRECFLDGSGKGILNFSLSS